MKNSEPVITFTNRIKSITEQIREVQEIQTGQAVTDAFRAELVANAIDCFKRCLKPVIEQNIRDAVGLDNVLHEALSAERRVEAKNDLRCHF